MADIKDFTRIDKSGDKGWRKVIVKAVEKIVAVKIYDTTGTYVMPSGDDPTRPIYTTAAGSGSAPLPTGASTAALQTALNALIAATNALLTTIDGDTGTIATNSSTIAGDTTSIDGKITACDTDDVTVAASALPTGAATEATLGTRALEAGGNLAAIKAQTDKVNFDVVDNAILTITHEHLEIHEGHAYYCNDHEATGTGTKYWRFTAPNTTTRIHLMIYVEMDAAGTVALYENPTINAAGTALTVYNKDRNSINAATLTVFKDTTMTSDGTLLGTHLIGSSSPAAKFGGSARSNFEWILDQGEDYSIKCVAAAGTPHSTITLEWYEV
jgi:hypothetical protein